MKWSPAYIDDPELNGSRMPIVVVATKDSTDPAEFAARFCGEIEEALLEHGAILLRAFNINTESFSKVSDALSRRRLDYVYRSTPRDKVIDKVFTATKYPADLEIPMHCENSYQRDWPMRLMLYCAQPASSGGETPLADMRKVSKTISKDILDQFEALGVTYVRNYTSGVDLSWQDVFQTIERLDVEQYCRMNKISFEWLGRDNLRTSQTCQGVSMHPGTGEKVFFNQAHLFHYTSVGQKNSEMLLRIFGQSNLPRNAFFGDGTDIGEKELLMVRNAFASEAKTFVWRAGDLLILDNMQIAHGRRAFTGARNVLVSMSDPYSEASPYMRREARSAEKY